MNLAIKFRTPWMRIKGLRNSIPATSIFNSDSTC